MALIFVKEPLTNLKKEKSHTFFPKYPPLNFLLKKKIIHLKKYQITKLPACIIINHIIAHLG